MRKLAVRGGTLVLNEFHPLQRKLFWTQGPRDYFQTKLTEADVPNPDAAGASLGKCLYRFWTMGEIVTAVIKAGFIVLMGPVNIFLLIAGFFLLPVAVILMAAWILLPVILSAGFDPIWFAVVLTINMEIGLISPSAGLNLYVINAIAPEISLRTILTGSLPCVVCMVLAIILPCVFPGLAIWLPDAGRGSVFEFSRRSFIHSV